MEITIVLRERNYLTIAVLSSVVMFFFLPFAQTLGLNTDLWYQVIGPVNFLLFVMFVAVFGIFVSFMLHRIREPGVCLTHKKGAGGGMVGTIITFFTLSCPACTGLTTLILPVSIFPVLSLFGPVFTLLSIFPMLLSIHLNGGFKK
jgi:hypothetical protein